MAGATELTRALQGRLVGEVLVLGKCPIDLSTSGVRPIGAPTDLAALRAIVGEYDAAVAAGWGKELSVRDVVGELRARVRPGGSVVVLVPTIQGGWRRAQGALLGVLSRQTPVAFEELCEAMLMLGLRDVVALEGAGPRGVSLVAARVTAGQDAAAESSIRGSLVRGSSSRADAPGARPATDVGTG